MQVLSEFLQPKMWIAAPVGLALFLVLSGILRLWKGRAQPRRLFLISAIACALAFALMLLLRLTYAISMQIAYYTYEPLSVLSLVVGFAFYVGALAFVHERLRAQRAWVTASGVAVTAVVAYPPAAMLFIVALCYIRGGCI